MIRILLIALFLATGTSTAGAQSNVQMTGKPLEGSSKVEKNPNLGLATLAGGCFWCTESDFRKVPGVIKVVSGYANGRGPNPTYENYAGRGYVEAVQVFYDPQKVSYQELLDYFWRHIDPTDAGGQFVDRGPQYRSVIYYHDEEQRHLAEESKKKLASSGPIQKLGKPVTTEITKFSNFYPAEDYHQDYADKNPVRYKYYRWNAGRDQFLEKVWGAKPSAAADPPGDNFTKPSDEVLRKKLTPLQYQVTQKQGTEPPFKNEYNDNHREGIYVDILSGEPLYSSTDKFNSGTGWPSFTKPLEPGNIVEREDRGWISVRTEVRSKHGDNHLGHVFNDGPPPTGLRYCMNSAALRFIPKEDLEKEGYGQYLYLFSQKK